LDFFILDTYHREAAGARRPVGRLEFCPAMPPRSSRTGITARFGVRAWP
jgi:hypothetical protein